MDFFYSIFGLLILLGILVTFHELGHYWVAKKLGIKALRFSVGFGKPFWSKYNKEGTEFAVAPIPLGGYVKFVDEREGDIAPEDLPYAFNRAPVWKRILVVLAGPMANFLLAIVVYAFMYMSGVPTLKPFISSVEPNSVAAQSGFPENSEIISVNGQEIRHLEDFVYALVDEIGNNEKVAIELVPDGESRRTVYLDVSKWKEPDDGNIFDSLGLGFGRAYTYAKIGGVGDGFPAKLAGIKKGDVITQINGMPIQRWSDISDAIEKPANNGVSNGEITMTVERDGGYKSFTLIPKTITEEGKKRAIIGIGPEYYNEFTTVKYGFFESFAKGAEETWTMIERIVSFLGKLVTGKLSIKNLGGPIGIAQGAGQVVQAGMVAFLSYLAMISVNLGFVNLLPIPMLDGGHLMYYLAELVRGKPVSEKIMELGMRFGIILLLAIMVIAIFNDINRI